MLPSCGTGDISLDVLDLELAAYYLQAPPWVALSSQAASKEENQKCQLPLKLERNLRYTVRVASAAPIGVAGRPNRRCSPNLGHRSPQPPTFINNAWARPAP